MVQETKNCFYAVRPTETQDLAAKKAGYDAIRRNEQQKRELAKAKEVNKYGAWGPVLKDRKTFNAMHFC